MRVTAGNSSRFESPLEVEEDNENIERTSLLGGTTEGAPFDKVRHTIGRREIDSR